MKKLSFVGVALVAMSIAGSAFADMDDLPFTTGLAVTNGGTHAGIASYIVRGTVEGVVVTITGAGATNAVTLTSADGQTIFSKSGCTVGTNTYPIVTPVFIASTGAALTDTLYAYNSVTNVSYTVARYGGIPVASKVTLSVVGSGTGTNTTAVKILYRK
jgi:hypothetical protein